MAENDDDDAAAAKPVIDDSGPSAAKKKKSSSKFTSAASCSKAKTTASTNGQSQSSQPQATVIKVETSNNLMKVAAGYENCSLKKNQTKQIFKVRFKTAPKTSAERGREFRARKQLQLLEKQNELRQLTLQSVRPSAKEAKNKKTSAERTRRWRERKKLVGDLPEILLPKYEHASTNPAKTAAQRMKEYRERQKEKRLQAQDPNAGLSRGSFPRSFTTTNRSRGAEMAKLSEVVSTLKKMAPLSLAESWDNVGLLIEPEAEKPIGCVFLTNDLTEDVLEEAESVGANLIVSYHPPLFVPFKRITSDTWKGRIASRCLSRGIAVYSPHTSWDAVENGLTDWLISCFDGTVSTIQPISESPEFSHVATLSSSSSSLDGKRIDTILDSHPDFASDEHFKVISSNGSQFQLLCNTSIFISLNKVAKAHDLHLHINKNESLPSSTAGTGRLCQFNDALSIGDVVERVKRHLGVDNLMLALARGSTLESTVDSAATVAGSGASVLRGVKAGLYLTGEMSHHDVLDAVHAGVTVVLANHSNTERRYLRVFAERLVAEMPRLAVCVSKVDSDPLTFV